MKSTLAGSVRRGSAAVEFAVCLPMMLLLLFGIWDLSRMVEVKQRMMNACRDAGRHAAATTKGTTKTSVENMIRSYLNHEASQGGLSIGTSGITATLTNLTSASRNDPELAEFMDHYRVTLTVPTKNFRIYKSPSGIDNFMLPSIYTPPTSVTCVADWYSGKDIPPPPINTTNFCPPAAGAFP